MRLLAVAAALLLVPAAAASARPQTVLQIGPTCRADEVRQHDEVVYGHFATRGGARRELAKLRPYGFQGVKIEDEGCGDFEVEQDGADTLQQRTSVAAEARRAGFEVSFEQTGDPLAPPKGQVVGVLARERSLAKANALAWRLAAESFRYLDIVPSGSRWLVVMPQVPVASALSIAREVARAGYHVQFRPA